MLTNIIIAIIVLHLVVGFGWLFFKLAPKEGEGLIDSQDEWENKDESKK